MYEFKLENATDMPLQLEARVDGQLVRGVMHPTSERYRFLHGTNHAVYICSNHHMLPITIRSLLNPEAPPKVLELCAEVGNHVVFLCDTPFTGVCSPLSLMMTTQKSFPREVCPGNLPPR
jgi:hypothetical protein